MTVPNTSVQPLDGGLGVQQTGEGLQCKVGTCSAGTEGASVLIGSPQQAEEELGFGPLARCVQHYLARTRKPVLAVRAHASSAGQIDGGAEELAGELSSDPDAFPVALAVGDTFIGEVDGGAPATATIAATRATKLGSGATYAAVTASHTLVVLIGGITGNQTITFAGTENTQALFHAKINENLLGGRVVNASGQTRFETDRFGSGASGSIISGDADVLASLGLSTGAFANAGPNNVANTEAVTAAELVAIFEAAFAGSTSVDNGDDSMTWRSDTTGDSSSVQLTSGTGVSKIDGFDTALHSGATGGGTMTKTGTGPDIDLSGIPLDAFEVELEITKGGARGTAEFRYTLDGGNRWIGPVVTAPTYAPANSGLVFNFPVGTYVLGTTYESTTTEPRAAVSDLQDAWPAVSAAYGQTPFDLVHVLGGGDDADDSASIAEAVSTLSAADEEAQRFYGVITECADVEEAAARAAFVDFESARVMVCFGTHVIDEPGGLTKSRSVAWTIAARAGALPASIDLASMLDEENPEKQLVGVRSISHDAELDPSMEAARFAVLRTQPGFRGFYVANPNMMAGPGSDFRRLQYRRIMDIACLTSQRGLKRYESSRIPVNAAGLILERAAQRIDADIDSRLLRAILQPGHGSRAVCRVLRDWDILSTEKLKAKVSVVPPGYAKEISATVAFVNPTLNQV
jgi:hypothetical protein